MYEDCAKHMRQEGEDDLADLVDMHQLLAEVVGSGTISEHRLDRFADGVSADPRFAIAYNAITRERTRQA